MTDKIVIPKGKKLVKGTSLKELIDNDYKTKLEKRGGKIIGA